MTSSGLHCLECGLEVAGADGGVAPKGVPSLSPGDFTVCIGCGHVMALDLDGSLRKLSERERNSIDDFDRLLLLKNARKRLEAVNARLTRAPDKVKASLKPSEKDEDDETKEDQSS